MFAMCREFAHKSHNSIDDYGIKIFFFFAYSKRKVKVLRSVHDFDDKS